MALFETRPLPQASQLQPKDTPDLAWPAIKHFFRHPSSWLLLALCAFTLLYRVRLGQAQWIDLAVVAGIWLIWPIMEWLIHRYLLHYRPITLGKRRIDFLLPQTHRWHHADPWNARWVFIPLHIYPLVAIPALTAALWLAANQPQTWTALSIYFVFALHYEWVHYLAHINWCPPLKYYQQRVKEHRLHHFKHERLWWGVSRGLGDRLLNTAPPPNRINNSDRCKAIVQTPQSVES